VVENHEEREPRNEIKQETPSEVEGNLTNTIPQDITAEAEEKTNESSTLADDWTEVKDPSSDKVYYYNTNTNETSWTRPEVVQAKASTISVNVDESEKKENTVGDESAVTKKEEEYPVTDVKEETDTSVVENHEEREPRNEIKQETPSEVEGNLTNTIPQDITAEAEEKTNESSTLADDWTEVKDPSSDKVYYYNTNTNETSWTRPEVMSKGEMNVVSAAFLGSEGDKSNDVGDGSCGWSEIKDPNTDKIYYYNTETNETSWEKPISMSGSEKTDDISSNEQNDWVETLDPSSGKNYYYHAKTEMTSWEKPACLKETDEPTRAVNDKTEAQSVHSSINQGEDIRSDLSTHLKIGVERTKSVEETFPACPPGEDEISGEEKQGVTPEPSKFATATPPGEISTPGTIFDHATSPSEPVIAPVVASEGVNESNEMDEGEMTDIPLSPEPILLNTTTKNMLVAYNLPETPNTKVTVSAPAPAPAPAPH